MTVEGHAGERDVEDHRRRVHAVERQGGACDTAIHEQGLETDEFPKATFTMTAPATLPAEPVKGRAAERPPSRATSSSTARRRPRAAPVEACWNWTHREGVGLGSNRPRRLRHRRDLRHRSSRSTTTARSSSSSRSCQPDCMSDPRLELFDISRLQSRYGDVVTRRAWPGA